MLPVWGGVARGSSRSGTQPPTSTIASRYAPRICHSSTITRRAASTCRAS